MFYAHAQKQTNKHNSLSLSLSLSLALALSRSLSLPCLLRSLDNLILQLQIQTGQLSLTAFLYLPL